MSMRFPRMLLVFLLPISFQTSTYSQKIVLNKEGKVLQAPKSIREKDFNLHNDVDTSALISWNNAEVTSFIKILSGYIEASVIAIKSNKTYFKVFWDDGRIDGAIQDLETIIKQLKSTPYNKSLGSSSPYYQLDSLIDNYCNNLNFGTERKFRSDYLEIKVYRNIIFKQLLLEYFNATIDEPDNLAIKNLLPQDKLNIQNDFIRYFPRVVLLLHTPGDVTVERLDSMYDVHYEIRKGKSGVLFHDILEAPFIRQWLFLNGAAIRLNPFPFTSSAYLGASTSEDPEKARLFDEYVDALLERYIQNDSTERIKEFVGILKQKGTGNEVFSKTTTLAEVVSRNDSLMRLVTTTRELKNQVEVPLVSSQYAHYLSYDASKKIKEAKDTVLNPLPTTQRISVTAYNVPRDAKVTLVKTKEEAIEDRSPFQTGLDSGLKDLGKLMTLIQPQLGIISQAIGVLNAPYNFQPPAIRIVTGPADKEAMAMVSIPKDRVRKFIIEEVNQRFDSLVHTHLPGRRFADWPEIGGIKFDERLFQYIFQRHVTQESYKPAEADSLRKLITFDYLFKMIDRHVVPTYVRYLQADSMYLEESLGILRTTLLPPARLEPTIDNENPDWRSVRNETGNFESATKLEYALFLAKGKDSTKLGQFSFKTGKRYFFQVGMGLAYTTVPVVTNEVKAEGDVITVQSKDQRFQAVVAGYFYPIRKGIFMQDKRFAGSKGFQLSRLNIMVGVSVPKPLDNIYTGIGYDLGPGLKLNTGVHFYRYESYELFNNKIVGESVKYRGRAPFFSIAIDPVSVLNAIGLFNK